MSLVMSADPGNKGAIALVSRRSVAVWDIPTLRLSRNGKNRQSIDTDALVALVKSLAVFGPTVAVLENVSAMPGDRKAGIFTFGRGFGALEAAVVAAGLPRTYVAPAKWTRDLGLTKKGDDAVRAYVKQAYPQQADLFARVTDGRADAVAIGMWALVHRPTLTTC